MIKLKHPLLFLLLVSTIWMGWKTTSVPADSAATCLMEIGEEELFIELGGSAEITVSISCPASEIVDMTWSTTDYLTCLDSDCLNLIVEPLASQCYTLTINWSDGCVSTDDFCVNVPSCGTTYDETNIVGITPNPIDDEAVLELEIARTQYVYIEIVDNDDILYPIKEGWMGPGLITTDLDFSAVPPGNYELRARLYPEFRYIDITIN